MQIHGFVKTTLLDYPGLVASTVFTGACNFRCPFCHNADLVLNPAIVPLISEEVVFDHLSKRKGIIKGICITGGEPTLQSDLIDFLEKLRQFDIQIKLDTNGYRPQILKETVNRGLVDYVAMDFKSDYEHYSLAAGVDVDTMLIEESVDFLRAGKVDYEFRTTVVNELHDREIIANIGKQLKGAKRYYLQGFVDSGKVISQGLSAVGINEMEEFIDILKPYIDLVALRGIE